MKKTVLVAAVFALALAGCAHYPGHHRGERAPDPHNPRVIVTGTYIVVDQEPIVIPKEDREPIVWQLPKDSRYTFPENGIVIDKAGDEFSCSVEQDKHRFVCRNRHTKPGKYHYTIRVMDGERQLNTLDPIVMND